MKKFLFSILVICSVAIPVFAFAGETIPTQSQCKKLSTISTSAEYATCCSGVSKAPACIGLTFNQQCSLGVLPVDQCQNQCDSIKSKNDYDVCCTSSYHAACTSLTTAEQCAFGAPINQSLCVSTSQVNPTQTQTYTPSATYNPTQCEAFSSIDSLDKYNSCCVDLKTNTPHSPQPTSCLVMTKNQQCSLGVLPAAQCQNQCNTITSVGDYTTCCTGAIVSNSCTALSQTDICLYKTFSSALEATNAGCPDATIAGFTYTGSASGGSLLGDNPANINIITPNVVVETSCSKVNLSKVNMKSFWEFFLWIRCYIGSLLPFLLTVAFLLFLWNIVNYIIKPNALKNDERKTYIIASLVGLFVLVTLWGLVSFASTTLGLGSVVPQLPYSTGK